jgi:hypothetical protein
MTNLDSLTTGEKTAGLSAVVLLASMFFDWFVVKIPDSAGVNFFSDGIGRNAWVSLGYILIVLVIAIAVPLGVVAWRLAFPKRKLPVQVHTAVMILGGVSALLILSRMIDPGNLESFHGVFGRTVSAELKVEYGIFIGLFSAAGIALGGYRSMRAKSVL